MRVAIRANSRCPSNSTSKVSETVLLHSRTWGTSMAESKKGKAGGAIDCPRFAVNSFHALATPTEMTLLCLSQVVGLSAEGEIEVGSLPAVQLGLSPAAAKELIKLLSIVVEKHEAEMGPITTPFLKG